MGNYKRLGAVQANGTIATPDLLYTCPSATGALTSTIAVCNRGASSQTFRLGVSSSTSFEVAGYLAYGATVAANDSVFLTLEATLDPATPYLLCSASSADVSFSAFGMESALA